MRRILRDERWKGKERNLKDVEAKENRKKSRKKMKMANRSWDERYIYHLSRGFRMRDDKIYVIWHYEVSLNGSKFINWKNSMQTAKYHKETEMQVLKSRWWPLPWIALVHSETLDETLETFPQICIYSFECNEFGTDCSSSSSTHKASFCSYYFVNNTMFQMLTNRIGCIYVDMFAGRKMCGV